MRVLRLNDIIGPIMVGPSSSHTAGAARIALMARQLLGHAPTSVEFKLYGSFAHTYQGHGTNKALIGGMLGFAPDDLRIRNSLQLAREAGLEVTFTPEPDVPCRHPNTIDVCMNDGTGITTVVRGVSIGGGAAVLRRINGVEVEITGQYTSVVVRHADKPGALAHIASSMSAAGVNIATATMFREHRGEEAYTVLQIDGQLPDAAMEAVRESPIMVDVSMIPAAVSGPGMGNRSRARGEEDALAALERFERLDFASATQMLTFCAREHMNLAQAFRAREEAAAASEGQPCNVDAYLDRVLDIMRDSATTPLASPLSSMGGLIGGEAQTAARLAGSPETVCDGTLAQACTYALAVLETNASMGRIVATPTAGSAGVVPAVLLALQKTRGLDDSQLREALLCAAAVGFLIARNATVSGAEGGCQAEVGTASAMAAAAAVQLTGGTAVQCLDAASNALCNLMGLVCDPVGGLVEVPCQKRNTAGAAVALVSAQVARAGVSNLVDFDQTVAAMYAVGRSLPFELRESALGGIAAAPSACDTCGGCGGGNRAN